MKSKEELLEEKKKLDKQLSTLNMEIANYKYNELKEKYGKDFCCEKCRFSGVTIVGNEYNTCAVYRIHGPCEEYLPDNDLSKFMKIDSAKKFVISDEWERVAAAFNTNWAVEDLLKHEEVSEKAMKIYKILHDIKEE